MQKKRSSIIFIALFREIPFCFSLKLCSFVVGVRTATFKLSQQVPVYIVHDVNTPAACRAAWPITACIVSNKKCYEMFLFNKPNKTSHIAIWDWTLLKKKKRTQSKCQGSKVCQPAYNLWQIKIILHSSSTNCQIYARIRYICVGWT